MSVEGLERVFAPRGIAVIGASASPTSVGGIIFENLTSDGFSGEVHPVNPGHEEVGGRPCYPGIRDVPGPLDVAIVCTPAPTVPAVVRECGEAGVDRRGRDLGRVPRGRAGRAPRSSGRSSRAAGAFRGLRVIGPNCLGFLVPGARAQRELRPRAPASRGIAP